MRETISERVVVAMKRICVALFVICLFLCSGTVHGAEGVTHKTKKVVFQRVYVDKGSKVELYFSDESQYPENHIYDEDTNKTEETTKESVEELKSTGFEIYRSNQQDGEYTLLATQDIPEGASDYSYADETVTEGETYYYKIRLLGNYTENVFVVNEKVKQDYENGLHDASYYDRRYIKWNGEWGDWEEQIKTFAGDFSEPLKVVAIQSPGKIESVRSVKAKTFQIKWEGVSNIDGYELYVKEFDNKYLSYLHDYSQYETEGCNDKSGEDSWDSKYLEELDKIPFKKAATISASAKSCKYKKAKHGYGYIFKLCTYKNVNGARVESTVSYLAHGVMDYYFCPNAENTKFQYSWPKTQKKAYGMCKTIKVKMWDFKNRSSLKGAKRTRIQYITVNKKYAATIEQIYKEIYKSKSKPPIYEAGSWRWRENDLNSYHTVGTAIDMNCNENPMYTYKGNKKVIAVGSFYKPKTNPYSMPRNGVIEKAFAKYGFVRLDHDLMHFNATSIYSSTNYKVDWDNWY